MILGYRGMLVALLASMLLGAPVAIRIASTDDWLIANLAADAIERTIDAGTDRGALRLANDERCKEQADRCVERTREDFEVDDVWLIRVFAGVTKHLVVIEAYARGIAEPKKATVSLLADGEGWAEQLAPVVAALLPGLIEARPPPAATASVVEPPSLWGPAMIIGSAAIVATAVILGERSRSTKAKLLDGTASSSDFMRLNRTRRAYAIGSLALYGLGGLCAGGGLILLWLQW